MVKQPAAEPEGAELGLLRDADPFHCRLLCLVALSLGLDGERPFLDPGQVGQGKGLKCLESLSVWAW